MNEGLFEYLQGVEQGKKESVQQFSKILNAMPSEMTIKEFIADLDIFDKTGSSPNIDKLREKNND